MDKMAKSVDPGHEQSLMFARPVCPFIMVINSSFYASTNIPHSWQRRFRYY